MKFEISTVEELEVVANNILRACDESHIFTLEGHLGAGKTTLVKQLCKALGCHPDEISSPSFSIVNEYHSDLGPIYHMDLYRVKNLEEALDFGMEEYLFSGNYCFIEWPEVAFPLLDMDYYKIDIQIGSSGKRLITVKFVNGLQQSKYQQE